MPHILSDIWNFINIFGQLHLVQLGLESRSLKSWIIFILEEVNFIAEKFSLFMFLKSLLRFLLHVCVGVGGNGWWWDTCQIEMRNHLEVLEKYPGLCQVQKLSFSNVFRGFRGLLEDLGDFYYKKKDKEWSSQDMFTHIMTF